ncbi:Hypothetical protein FKW44_014163 [Caligus rogercresseyi]|uniref:Uncharacterized protein n=1 Tax=Caligus rogercresseyi TaxID=217165 RepID=A0A7T8GYK4_CALRO|nr:Hypothetical protein FKW44_014163 [Caligus rogercresseyi]
MSLMAHVLKLVRLSKSESLLLSTTEDKASMTLVAAMFLVVVCMKVLELLPCLGDSSAEER